MEDAEPLVRRLLAERDVFLGFVRSRMRTAADAEDVLQQALLKASQHADDLREPAVLRAWFFRILRRTIADHLGEGARQTAKKEALAELVPEPTTLREPAICGCTMGLLKRLRPEYADILRRIDLDEQSLTEAAAALGVRVENATMRLHRARRALREELARFCGTHTLRACLDCGCDA